MAFGGEGAHGRDEQHNMHQHRRSRLCAHPWRRQAETTTNMLTSAAVGFAVTYAAAAGGRYAAAAFTT
jgi:hypothetical protein